MEIPQFGFGVFQVPPEETAQTVRAAFDAGYRHIDTAQMYGNEEGVGQALAESGLSRDEVFITTKLNNDGHGYDAALQRLDESLKKLGTDHVDLYLIHWPRPARRPLRRDVEGLREGGGRGQDAGRSASRTSRSRTWSGSPPRPGRSRRSTRSSCTRGFPQSELRAYHAQHGIATEAWSPIGQGKGLLDDPTLAELARKYGKTPAQVVLRWHVQLGNIVFPKSMHPERMRENIDVFDFELDPTTSRP